VAKKTQFWANYDIFEGSCTDPLLPMRVKFGVLQQAQGLHWPGRLKAIAIGYIFSCRVLRLPALRTASNEVIIQLIKTKCFPVLYYGLEACPLRKSQYNSIDCIINSSFRKVFNTKSQEVIDVCLDMFNCLPARQVIALRINVIFFFKNSVQPTMIMSRVCRQCSKRDVFFVVVVK